MKNQMSLAFNALFKPFRHAQLPAIESVALV